MLSLAGLWATLFVELWKRKESRTAMLWGMVGLEAASTSSRTFFSTFLSNPNALMFLRP